MKKPSLSLEAWVRDGSVGTRNRVIEDHSYLCVRAARKFVRRGVERCDLEQVAAVGLIKAVDRYNPHEPAPFEAYAWRLVLGELMHYVRDCERIVRAPRRLRELERRFDAAEKELIAKLGRQPKLREIADAIGANDEEAIDICRYRDSNTVVSVEALRPNEYPELAYTIEEQLDRILLERCLGVLSPIEQEVVRAIYQHDISIVELAARLGYSRRHVSRLHGKALKKLSAIARPTAS